MRHTRFTLVVSENGEEATTDGPTELSAVPANADSGPRRLHLVDTDEGTPPDDAA
jgi:hypothetical protein